MTTASPLIKLQTTDHEDLLNVIDQLRAEGVSEVLSLPQLIVCGDQSSGKSSVLEAISGLKFPTKDNVCTRFATELILRRSPETNVVVRVFPDKDRSFGEKLRLKAFNPPKISLEEFDKLVADAAKVIGVEKEGYAKDVLRVEVSGPSQPELTLVDLPGLYHAADESQDEAGVDFVESLVLSYMMDERSVILAVLNANNDIALQKVTKFTRKVDPEGRRTMGIITKPDLLAQGSDLERSFHSLAMNQRVVFDLGWHVLKNRSFQERDTSRDERDRLESRFFSTGIWQSISPNQRGIESLRPRLSNILLKHIVSELPSLLAEARQFLKSAQADLHRLGMPRQNLAEQRQYLLQMSDKFTLLITDAINGTYVNNFFGDALLDLHYHKRLRAVVQNQLQLFADKMQRFGHQVQILDHPVASGVLAARPCVLRSQYMSEVKQRMLRTRGRELPGTFNPLIIGDLFYAYSKPWEDITLEFGEMLLKDVQNCVVLILEHVAGKDGVDKLLKYLIGPVIGELEGNLREKTEELLSPHRRGHPITYDHHLITTIQHAREKHYQDFLTERLRNYFKPMSDGRDDVTIEAKFTIKDLVANVTKNTEQNMDDFACSEAIDCMQAYYEVARKKYVDEFSVHAIEKCLLEPTLKLFCSQTVAALSDDMIKDIAQETEFSQNERSRLASREAILKTALSQLAHLERFKSSDAENQPSQPRASIKPGSQDGQSQHSMNENELAAKEVTAVADKLEPEKSPPKPSAIQVKPPSTSLASSSSPVAPLSSSLAPPVAAQPSAGSPFITPRQQSEVSTFAAPGTQSNGSSFGEQLPSVRPSVVPTPAASTTGFGGLGSAPPKVSQPSLPSSSPAPAASATNGGFGGFGSAPAKISQPSVLSSPAPAPAAPSTGFGGFGSAPPKVSQSSLFSSPAPVPATAASWTGASFGQHKTAQPSTITSSPAPAASSTPFGSAASVPVQSLFGGSTASVPVPSLFGGSQFGTGRQ